MDSWRHHMPKNMLLKSPGMATNLSSPTQGLRFSDYCAQIGEPYDDHRIAPKVDVFNAYAQWFRQREAPMLEEKLISHVEETDSGFLLKTDDGEICEARRVVVAAGITSFANMPSVLEHLSRDYVSHSFRWGDVSSLKGKRVAVLGAGSSAVDLAAQLDDEGAKVTVIARGEEIRFHTPPSMHDESILNHVKYPLSGIGAGWRSFMCCAAPLLFKRLPEHLRLRAVKNHLGPAPGWFMRERFAGKIATLMQCEVVDATLADGKVALRLRASDGITSESFDHVVAATGYRPDLRRLKFLSPDLLGRIAMVENTPILSDWFESSVPGLYFQGIASANSFGPLMRFMYGTEYAAPRLSRHLARSATRELRRAA
jgi:thioredoxin reductase